MEDWSGGGTMAISNSEAFANHITINLFKKKSNSKFINCMRTVPRRTSRFVAKNSKQPPTRMQNVSQQTSDLISHSNQQHDVMQDATNLVTNTSIELGNNDMVIDQITNQVTTPFSSSYVNPMSPLREMSFTSQNLSQVTTNQYQDPFYSPNLQNYQTSQENYISTSIPSTMPSQNPQITKLSNMCTSQPSFLTNETQKTVLATQNSHKLNGHFPKASNPCQLRPAVKSPSKSSLQSAPGDDLTPLSWLQSLDMGGVVPHLATPPTPPASPPLGSPTPGTIEKPVKPEPPPEKIDYSANGSVKPPFSYAALIGMAMKENENKMTLSAIYKWIKDHYAYYKTADQSWQNSIRHNLSLNKCFLKVARSKDEPGKGGFWKLDPEYAESLVDGVFKKRRPTKGTPPPTTKSKRSKRGFPFTQQQQIQQQVMKQRQREQEELQRQREQEEAVRSLLHPVQEAYMPPPTDKPPTMNSIYQHEESLERTLLGDEAVNQLKDDFVWSFLGDESEQDDTWKLETQEVVTDITQSGDPSTYQVTASPTHSIASLSSGTSIMSNYSHSVLQQQQQQQQSTPTPQHHIQTLPSFELSPESLGVEEDLFGTPEYSEASNDEGDSLMSSLDLGVGLDLAVSTTPWPNEQTCQIYNIIHSTIKESESSQNLESIDNNMIMKFEGSHHDLIEFHDFEGNLTQLTALEPVTPVVVQQISQPGWNHEQQHSWDEAKTFSLLEANLDFDRLIDLDVI